MNGERVGYWEYVSTKGHAFRYEATWLDHPLARPLSLSLPLSRGTDRYTGDGVESYFDNLLPDSLAIRQRVASKFDADSTRAFSLLAKIGRDCVGAVQLLAADAPAPDVRRIDAEPVSEAEVEQLLDRALAGRGVGTPEEEDLRISLAGAQEKTALLYHDGRWCRPFGATPTTHILKLPLGEVGGMRADFSTSVENEWLCARLLRAYGLPVADCGIAAFGRYKVLVVTRFDRRFLDGWWARLPQEDFCQAKGLPSERKYEERGGPGMTDILDTLRGSEHAEADRNNFLAMQLLFWLLAAPDGHAKNFSIFLEPHGRFRLTPFYDVMSAWPVMGKGARHFQWQKVKMAMAVHSKNIHYRMVDIRRRHWNTVARENALGMDFERVIQHFVEVTPAVIDTVAAEIPAGFPEEIRDRVFDGMLAQLRRLEADAVE